MKKHNLAFIDVETTGLDPERHEIIEIGCIVVKQIPQSGGKGCAIEVVDEFETKVKPEHIETAEPEALRINGYNSGDWLFAADLKQAMKTLSELTDGANMIGQNVFFDWQFIDRAFKTTGVPNKMHYHRIDLMSMAFAKCYHEERLQRFNLGALCDYFGVKNDAAHTALADIRATVEVYKKLLAI